MLFAIESFWHEILRKDRAVFWRVVACLQSLKKWTINLVICKCKSANFDFHHIGKRRGKALNNSGVILVVRTNGVVRLLTGTQRPCWLPGHKDLRFDWRGWGRRYWRRRVALAEEKLCDANILNIFCSIWMFSFAGCLGVCRPSLSHSAFCVHPGGGGVLPIAISPMHEEDEQLLAEEVLDWLQTNLDVQITDLFTGVWRKINWFQRDISLSRQIEIFWIKNRPFFLRISSWYCRPSDCFTPDKSIVFEFSSLGSTIAF